MAHPSLPSNPVIPKLRIIPITAQTVHLRAGFWPDSRRCARNARRFHFWLIFKLNTVGSRRTPPILLLQTNGGVLGCEAAFLFVGANLEQGGHGEIERQCHQRRGGDRINKFNIDHTRCDLRKPQVSDH